MASKMEALKSVVEQVLGDRLVQSTLALDELSIVCKAENIVEVATLLRDHAELSFEQLIDLCGVDYSTYKDQPWDGPRFAVVYHLLSLKHNWRIRLKTFAPEDVFPVLNSVVGVWNSANWFEREAFDFFGIVFDGHPDLRRLLTDYGFVGHPFRKDFPVSGYVEMRYDPTQQRVIYQPVTIEPREITPRIIREETYGG
ncbi:MAG: NADH-quinone oxidoreductase subunit C [Pseudogulbenkiania sp.]|nr:NADH-quinone oxidoreductase subunit C [Pseudogulbenkiania sp.]